MRKRSKKIFFIGLIIFLLMQVYQPARNISYEQDTASNFTNVYKVPKNIETILQTSCYDCHSNNTNYPWYSHIQPGASFMSNHIKESKKELNFSEFGSYSKRKRESKLKAIINQIKSDEMPLKSYTLLHGDATLSNKQKSEITTWIDKLINDNSNIE